jgi:hypothetical protein
MEILNTFYNRFVKAFLATAVCALMVLGVASPAMAFGSTPSDSSKGLVEMNEMKETSKDAVRKEPRNAKEVQAKAKRGTNAVQGDANLEKMNNPDNSRAARTIEAQAKDVLENITPGS